MKTSKALKALLVFGMSIATATSLATATACNDDKPSGHDHDYQWVTTDAQHWKECKADGHEGDKIDPATPKADHKYDQAGDKCVCGKEKPATSAHEDHWVYVNTDADNHWQVCDAAGHQGDTKKPDSERPHVYDQKDGTECVCGKAKPEDAHTHDYQWVNTDKNEHWKECDFDLEEQAGTRGAHVDANHDNTCDDCGYNGGALPEAYTTLLGKEGTEAVVADTFLKSGALTTFGKWGTAGVYTAHNSKGTDEGNYSEVKDGIVKMTDSTGGATHTVIDFGGVIGTIEGYFEMTFENAANSWTPVQFYSTADKEFFGLRTDGGSIKYRLDGGSPVAAATDIAPADLTKYAVYFKYDRANNKLTMTINDKAFAEVSVNVEGVAGFKLVSSDSNGRIINLDNLVVVNTPVAFADYKAELDAKVTSMMPPADNQYTSAEAKAKLGAALAAYNTASAAATTNAQIKAAYDTFETEYVGAVKLEVKAQLLLAYPANKYNTNKADYDKAIADFDSALEKASSMQAVQKAMEDAQKVLGAIEDDTHAAIANITVEVKNAEGITVGSVTVKAGTTVTADDLKTEISAPTGKRVEGFYTEAACTTAAELPLDTTGEAVDKTYTYYVKFEDIPASEIVTHTLDVTAVSATAYTAETDLDGFFSVNNKVKQESAKMNSGTYTKQVSLTGGKADMSNNAIKFTITKSAVVTVVAGAKSDKSTVKLSVLDSKGAAATVTDIKLNGTASEFQNLPVATSDKTAEIAVTYTFRLEAGTYYFGGNGGGAYIFALSVAEGA